MVEFIEETHQYLLNGVLLPSVTTILAYKYPNKYKGVPDEILSKKANFGTNVHKAIEMNTEPQGFYEKLSYKQYIKLQKRNDINPLEQEKIVINKELGYIGTLDMIAEIKGETCLCDIKTTAKLDEEYVSWQLSMYELATEKTFDKLYVIWLPKKDIGHLIEVQRTSKKDIEKLVLNYKKEYGIME